MVKSKRWKDGKEFYTQALAVLHKESKEDPTSNTDQGAEIQEEKKIEEACYINRALCNLELRTFPRASSTSQIPCSPPLPPVTLSDPHRKLPLHDPRLRLNAPAQPVQLKSLLPLLPRPPCTLQAARSIRCLQHWPGSHSQLPILQRAPLENKHTVRRARRSRARSGAERIPRSPRKANTPRRPARARDHDPRLALAAFARRRRHPPQPGRALLVEHARLSPPAPLPVARTIRLHQSRAGNRRPRPPSRIYLPFTLGHGV